MWILINYPVVDSMGRDNRGGYSHLLANIACYNMLGYKCLVIARFNWKRIVHIVDGTIFFNIVPGRKIPGTFFTNENQDKRFVKEMSIFKAFRNEITELFVKVLIQIFDIAAVHERLNMRFSVNRISSFYDNIIFLYEKNDEYMHVIKERDILLVTPDDNIYHENLLSASWPVLSVGNFEKDIFFKKMQKLKLADEVNVCLYGVGGIHTFTEIMDFLLSHDWLKDKKRIKLTICGASRSRPDIHSSRFETNQVSALPANELKNFDLGLVFYADAIYDDERVRIGNPTKIYNYIDASLPFISNREYLSSKYLLNYDDRNLCLMQHSDISFLTDHLIEIRRANSVERYSNKLKCLLTKVRGSRRQRMSKQ